jgi:hypothetical protein
MAILEHSKNRLGNRFHMLRGVHLHPSGYLLKVRDKPHRPVRSPYTAAGSGGPAPTTKVQGRPKCQHARKTCNSLLNTIPLHYEQRHTQSLHCNMDHRVHTNGHYKWVKFGGRGSIQSCTQHSTSHHGLQSLHNVQHNHAKLPMCSRHAWEPPQHLLTTCTALQPPPRRCGEGA